MLTYSVIPCRNYTRYKPHSMIMVYLHPAIRCTFRNKSMWLYNSILVKPLSCIQYDFQNILILIVAWLLNISTSYRLPISLVNSTAINPLAVGSINIFVLSILELQFLTHAAIVYLLHSVSYHPSIIYLTKPFYFVTSLTSRSRLLLQPASQRLASQIISSVQQLSLIHI